MTEELLNRVALLEEAHAKLRNDIALLRSVQAGYQKLIGPEQGRLYQGPTLMRRVQELEAHARINNDASGVARRLERLADAIAEIFDDSGDQP
jgi:hypothetical protein